MTARRAPGHAVRLVAGAELAALAPGLLDAPPCALYAPSDGATHPAAATRALLRAARAAGARVLAGTPAAALAVHHGRVVGVCTTGGYGGPA